MLNDFLFFLQGYAFYIVLGVLILVLLFVRTVSDRKEKSLMEQVDIILTKALEEMQNTKVDTVEQAQELLYDKLFEVAKHVDFIPNAQFDNIALYMFLQSEYVESLVKREATKLYNLKK